MGSAEGSWFPACTRGEARDGVVVRRGPANRKVLEHCWAIAGRVLGAFNRNDLWDLIFFVFAIYHPLEV